MTKQWLEETENLLHSIERERQVLAEEHEKLGRELAAKNEEITHLQAVIQLHQNRQQVAQPSLFLQEPNTYKGLSHKEVIFLVRDQNKGFIPMNQVTEIFKHKVTTPNHAASVAYSTLSRIVKQGKITKVKPGLYRWVNGSQTPTTPPTAESVEERR